MTDQQLKSIVYTACYDACTNVSSRLTKIEVYRMAKEASEIFIKKLQESEHKSVLTPEQEFLQMNTPITIAVPTANDLVCTCNMRTIYKGQSCPVHYHTT